MIADGSTFTLFEFGTVVGNLNLDLELAGDVSTCTTPNLLLTDTKVQVQFSVISSCLFANSAKRPVVCFASFYFVCFALFFCGRKKES